MMQRWAAAAAMLLAGFATAQTPEAAFKDFARCDGAFFTAANVAAFNPGNAVAVVQSGSASSFKLPAAGLDGSASVAFKQPVTVNGISLTGWYNEHFEIAHAGSYYAWGFTAQGQLDAVVKALQPLAQQVNVQALDTEQYLRTETRTPGPSIWAVQTGAPSPVANNGHLLRVLKVSQKKNGIQISCVLGGALDASELRLGRPDLSPADYPYDPALDDANPAHLPAALRTQLDALLAAHPELTPRFKSLHLDYTTSYSGAEQKAQTEMTRSGPFIAASTGTNGEVYLQNLSLAGLFDLQVRLISRTSPGKLDQIKSLNATLPDPIKPGTHFSLSAGMGKASLGADVISATTLLDCTAGAPIEARTLHAALSGKATPIACRSGSTGDGWEGALVDNLGVILPTANLSNGLRGVVRYSRIEIKH